MKARNVLAVLTLLWMSSSTALLFSTPLQLVSQFVNKRDFLERKPLAQTLLLARDDRFDENVVYTQKSLGENVKGYEELLKVSQKWDEEFQSDLGVTSSINRISSVTPNTVLVDWNVTWVPPSALWIEGFGNLLGVEILFATYNHLAPYQATFSWKAVGDLFQLVLTKRQVRVPLACIEGKTELRFSGKTSEVESISEELSYAIELQRGQLQNRKCAQDLRVFLETARRLYDDTDSWYEKVYTGLPWQTVAGSNPLDIDPVEDGPIAATIFVLFTVFSTVIFATFLAPILLGAPIQAPVHF